MKIIIEEDEIWNPDQLSEEERAEIDELAITAIKSRTTLAASTDDDPITRGLINGRLLQVFGKDVSESGYNSFETKELSIEQQIEQLLATLEKRFYSTFYRKFHKGLSWDKVKKSLVADKTFLLNLLVCEKAGHKTTVYNYDETGFDIGTCSAGAPKSGRNSVYDEKAETDLKEQNKNEYFNGNAEQMANSMGAELMTLEQIRLLYSKKHGLDLSMGIWIKTDDKFREKGQAFYVRNWHQIDTMNPDEFINYRVTDAKNHDNDLSYRVTMRVPWAK
jgi:hypothetical protein